MKQKDKVERDILPHLSSLLATFQGVAVFELIIMSYIINNCIAIKL